MPIPRARQSTRLLPETGFIHEIRSDTLAFSRKAQVASSAISMRLSGDGEYLYVLCDRPKRLVRFQTASFRTDLQAPLPAIPVDFDVDPEDKWIAVSFGTERALGFAAAGERALLPLVKTSGDIGKVRFQGNSGQLVVANLSERMLSVYQVRSRRLVVNLPLAVRPDNLCFNADGGQLFITGEGGDAVVVVYPYFTPEVAGTVLAGHAPAAMAATRLRTSPQYLFVSNPKSGEVSILDIPRQRVIAVTQVGAEPSEIVLTPDDAYALVLNRSSGDMAVLRVANITRAVLDFSRSRKGPIFMMIPVGSRPVSAAVMPI